MELEVESVGIKEKERVIEDITRLVEMLGVGEFIGKIVIASDFSSAVKSHLPADEAASYDPAHDYGRAIGKTLSRLEGDQLTFSIVFDARLFSDPSGTNAFDRQYYVLHELVHVQNGLLRYRSTGRQSGSPPQDKSEYFAENAWRIWEEYCSERFSAEVIAGAAKTIDPQAEVGFASTVEFANDVLRRLNDFELSVPSSILRFRLGGIDITELTRSVSSRIAEIAIQLAYVYALLRATAQVAEKVAEIEAHRAFRRFFGGGWQGILKALKEWYEDRHTYRRDLLDMAANGYETIFLSSGLEMTDIPNGYYVRVLDV